MSSESEYINAQYQGFFEDSLSKTDPELFKAIKAELNRQQEHIELIASENIVSQAVLEAQGSVLTNKYAEGYPGKRYYDACEYVDVAETLAIERLKKLFDCKFANAQPHSGAQANGAVSGVVKTWRYYNGYESEFRWTSYSWIKSLSFWKMV